MSSYRLTFIVCVAHLLTVGCAVDMPKNTRWEVDKIYDAAHPGHTHFLIGEKFWTRKRWFGDSIDFMKPCRRAVFAETQTVKVLGLSPAYENAERDDDGSRFGWFYYTLDPIDLPHEGRTSRSHHFYFLEWGESGSREGITLVCDQATPTVVCMALRSLAKSIDRDSMQITSELEMLHPGAAHTHESSDG